MTQGGTYEAAVLWFMDIMSVSEEPEHAHEWDKAMVTVMRQLGKDAAMDAVAEAYRRRAGGVFPEWKQA